MAGQRLTDKTELDELAAGDLLMAVDVSDTTSSADGTSKKMKAENLIVTSVSEFTSAEVNALNVTPQTIVAQPGTMRGIVPLSVIMECVYATTDNTNNYYMYIGQHGSSTSEFWSSYRSFFKDISSTTTFAFSAAGTSSGMLNGFIDNQPLKIWSNGAFNGDWTLKVYATYQIIEMA
jgi:membrane-associated protease RseP (regulator of RpoE activity)